MHLFYTPDIIGEEYTLDKEESKHCVRVLRLEEGDEIALMDGHGTFYYCRIVQASPSACSVKCFRKEETEPRPFKLTLAVAPTKNIDRTEWFLEKCTEIGTECFIMMQTEHSERKIIKQERLDKVIIAAMKQSLKAYKPELTEMLSFKEIVDGCSSPFKFIAHCNPGEKRRLNDCYRAGEDVTLLIGPEGDFSEKEVAYALGKGFVPITLGNSRLRTETAGLVACHSINFMNRV